MSRGGGWGRVSMAGQDCLWPVTERDWIQVTGPFQALQQKRGRWACLGAQTSVSPAPLLGGKSIPGLQWRGARTKLQDICRVCVALRLGHQPPRAQTDKTPGSCLGEQDCSQPEAGSQRSQKSTVVPNCCYWRAMWVGRAPVPPSCWCHLGNNWPLEMWQVKERLQILTNVCVHVFCNILHQTIFWWSAWSSRCGSRGKKQQEKREKEMVVKLRIGVSIFSHSVSLYFKKLCSRYANFVMKRNDKKQNVKY